MEYLFSAYSVFFLLIGIYIIVLDKRQKKINKEINLLEDMLKKNN